MKYYKYALFIVMLSVLASVSFAQSQSKPDTRIRSGDDLPFYYALPKTVCTLILEVRKISLFRGPFADYADKLPGLPYWIEKDSICYQVMACLLQISAVPDFEQLHSLTVPQNANAKYTFDSYGLFSLNNKNLPQATETRTVLENCHPVQTKRFPWLPAAGFIVQHDTVYTTQIRDDSTHIMIPQINQRFIPKSTLAMAQDAVKMVEQIREQYYMLIAGEHETDYTQLPLMLRELKEKEKEYTAMFAGKTEEEMQTYQFSYCPASAQKADRIRIPLQDLWTDKDPLPDFLTGYDLHLRRIDNRDLPEAVLTENTSDKRKKQQSYYRRPAYYEFHLTCKGNHPYVLGVFPLAQFGTTHAVPAKAVSYSIDDLTGSIKEIQYGGKQRKK
jgi:hypothetical protein